MSILKAESRIGAICRAAALWEEAQVDTAMRCFGTLDEARAALRLTRADLVVPHLSEAEVLTMINEVLQVIFWKEVSSVR